MNTRLEKQMNKLSQQFPAVWMKDGEDFAEGYSNSIWTGEGSEIEDQPAFSAYSYTSTQGVHPQLAQALDLQGLYAEFHDAGTVFIWSREA